MTGNPKVIAALQSILVQEATLHLQDRFDRRVLKFMGVNKVASKLQGFGAHTHEFMRLVTDQILALGGDPSYTPNRVSESDNLTGLLNHQKDMEMALVMSGRAAVATSVGAGDEATAEKLRHIEERHEDHVLWLEKQLRLIGSLGEPAYIAEKL